MANDWTTTEADTLPWGETVEVRWNTLGGDYLQMSPCIESGEEYWFDDDHMYYIAGTEWRRLENG